MTVTILIDWCVIVIILVVDPFEGEEDFFRKHDGIGWTLIFITTSNVCTFLEMFCLYGPCLQHRKACDPGERSVVS